VRADSIVSTIIGEPFGDRAIGRVDVWEYDARKWDAARRSIGTLIHNARR